MDDIIDSMDMSLSKLREIMKDREAWQSMRSQSVKIHLATEQPLITISWLREPNKQVSSFIHYLRKQKRIAIYSSAPQIYIN